MKPSKEFRKLETDFFVVKVDRSAYKYLRKICKKKGISLDYFFFEFAGIGKHDDWGDSNE
tara:strand:+ start:423 stop:602 length:180 start_codon:yes stop_codon:yes gene_type:complete